jgi:hypothetical protein
MVADDKPWVRGKEGNVYDIAKAGAYLVAFLGRIASEG